MSHPLKLFYPDPAMCQPYTAVSWIPTSWSGSLWRLRLCLAVLVQYRSVSDRQTDAHTHTHRETWWQHIPC